MEEQPEKLQSNNNGQLILVPHKDTIRLLEVYLNRSLSLSESDVKKAERKAKWVTMPRRLRRHSSDPSIHLSGALADDEIGEFTAVQDNPPETLAETLKTLKKKRKKSKKPSLWKNFLELFSRKDAEEKDVEPGAPAEDPDPTDGAFEAVPPAPAATVPRRKSKKKRDKKRSLSRRRSIMISNKIIEVLPEDISVEAVTSVEPTYAYYEKVTEELEKIVHEVKVKEEAKPLTDDEVIKRIIALTKEQGDAIDYKIKDNPTLSQFFQAMSYSSFQRLTDAYLEEEATAVQNPPTVPPTAPELVKLAFTLDFTARIAGLSRQNLGHITVLGNRYLQDRFEYNQAITDHPWSDCDD